MKRTIRFTVNGHPVEVDVYPHWNLLRVLREELELTGAKQGCGEGECGACTVLVNHVPVNSCIYPVVEAEGKEVLTIEGLMSQEGELHPIQQAFLDKALLDANPHPTETEIRHALAGNMCRCTGYVQIVESVVHAAELMSRRSG
jgi:carbon-monoxide dehydrogenase small subunit